MKATIAHISQAMRQVLGEIAEKSAQQTGFSQRQSKLNGPVFVQTLALGWLNNPKASLESLSQAAAALGVEVSPQALDQRFSPKAAECIKEVLQAAVSEVVCSTAQAIPVFERFSAVIIYDSSIVVLPEELSKLWQGCGGSGADSAIKLSVSLDMVSGALGGPELADGYCHDQRAASGLPSLPRGALRLTDLGYFSLDAFEEMSRTGAYFISRFKVGTRLFGEDGTELELPQVLYKLGKSFDLNIELGSRHRLKLRLLGERVPKEVADHRKRKLREAARKKMRTPSKAQLSLCEWTLLVTNAPAEGVSLKEALVLIRARWQIEMLFKLWKQSGQIDEWRSQKPYRILCELYAKLLAMIIQHWVLLTGCWSYPDRSLMKAAQTVRSYAVLLASAIGGLIELEIAISHIVRCISAGCKLNKRRKRPGTFQLLMNLAQEPLS